MYKELKKETLKFQAWCQTCYLFIDVINDPGVLLAAVLEEQARYTADCENSGRCRSQCGNGISSASNHIKGEIF